MLVKESILQDALYEAIAEINKRPNHVEKTLQEKALHMFNITGGEMSYILNGRTPVDTMSEDTMFKVTSILFDYLSNDADGFPVSKLDVNKYFTENEQKKYSKKINRKNVETDIVREYYIPISDDQIMISFTNKELAQLTSTGRIHYNPETQRALTTIETENGSYQKVTINTDAYNSIFDDVNAGDYISNMLTFNINPDSNEQPRIIDKQVIIPKTCIIDCIDGYHRLKAIVTVTKLKPELEIVVPIMLTGFDVKKAKRYILQEDKKTHLTKEQVAEDNQDDAANFIIGKLKNSSYLKDSGIQNISYQINKIINVIFNPEKLKSTEAIQKAFNLFKHIETKINEFIENNGCFGKEFTKEEWFIYLYLINYCDEHGKEFLDVVEKINIDKLLEQISITNEPIKKHFRIMSEVTSNV